MPYFRKKICFPLIYVCNPHVNGWLTHGPKPVRIALRMLRWSPCPFWFKTWTFWKGFQWGMFMVLELQDNATWMLLNQRAWSNYSYTCYSISNIKKLENCSEWVSPLLHFQIMNNIKTATMIQLKHPNVDRISNPKSNFLLYLLYVNRLN